MTTVHDALRRALKAAMSSQRECERALNDIANEQKRMMNDYQRALDEQQEWSKALTELGVDFQDLVARHDELRGAVTSLDERDSQETHGES